MPQHHVLLLPRQVQDAIGTGYLSAFPEEHFDRLQSLQPVWAPFYVVRLLRYFSENVNICLQTMFHASTTDWQLAKL